MSSSMRPSAADVEPAEFRSPLAIDIADGWLDDVEAGPLWALLAILSERLHDSGPNTIAEYAAAGIPAEDVRAPMTTLIRLEALSFGDRTEVARLCQVKRDPTHTELCGAIRGRGFGEPPEDADSLDSENIAFIYDV